MKNLGWYLFFALLLGDIVAVVMLRLGVTLKVVVTVAALGTPAIAAMSLKHLLIAFLPILSQPASRVK